MHTTWKMNKMLIKDIGTSTLKFEHGKKGAKHFIDYHSIKTMQFTLHYENEKARKPSYKKW